MGVEMAKKHGDEEEVVGIMRIEGKNIVRKTEKAMKVIEVNKKLDVVLLEGTTNSLVVHGKRVEWGFGGEGVRETVGRKNGQPSII